MPAPTAYADASPTLLFGGCCTARATMPAATEAFDTATGTWQPVTITGGSPPPRVGAAMGYDPASGDLVMFGGEYLPGGPAQPVALNDTWELSYQASANTGTWTQVDGSGCLTTCPGAPPGRYGASADQAPGGQGVVLFGGLTGTTAPKVNSEHLLADIWTWNGPAWSQACVSCTPVPPPTFGAAIAYHGSAAQDLLYGGYTDTAAPAAPATTWAWTGTGWIAK